jgi:PhoH-like ATPase
MPADQRRLFILDTNVLMHDPTAVFRFNEHDVYLPMVVLEELDAGKKGLSETARNARQSSRFLDELMTLYRDTPIAQGLPLAQVPYFATNNSDSQTPQPSGRLLFEMRSSQADLPESLPGSRPDNSILGTALAVMATHAEHQVTLVSKDINLRIKANVVGVHAEDYHNDQVLEDASLLYSGISALEPDFWDNHGRDMASWQDDDRTFYRLQGPDVGDWVANECLYWDGTPSFDAIVREIDSDGATIEHVRQYYSDKQAVWGIKALNREQNFALNLLLDPEIEFVTLVGMAGTGKTLLALAAGLEQTLEDRAYTEIIMTRVTVPVGEDIGFLPGTEEDKMAPWMGALMDNLEVLSASGGAAGGGSWERQAANDLLSNRVKVRSVNFMRGRTFLNRYLIIDEAQNLTPKQMKTLITRAGHGTKIVCLGNIAQIDTPYLSETNCGLTYVVDRFKGWPHAGHLILTRGERSRLADYASEVL